MIGLTVNQPYASLLASGAKHYETRSWNTKYRGPIAIHAGKKAPEKTISTSKELSDHVEAEIAAGIIPQLNSLPMGAIIAIGELVNTWRIVYHPGTDEANARAIRLNPEKGLDTFIPTAKEFAYGYWAPGYYAWEIVISKVLVTPVPFKGQLGLWKAPLIAV